MNKSHLKRHENICSSKSSVLACERCSYITDRRSNLNRHNCQNKCVQCQDVFPTRRQLSAHVVKVHERVCSICGKEFSRKDNLKTHVKSLHNLTIADGALKTSIGYLKLNEVLEKKANRIHFCK